jgi:hemoglobin
VGRGCRPAMRAPIEEESPMTLNPRWIRNSLVRAAVASLPITLAGCSFLFPAHSGMNGHAAPSGSAPAPSTAPAPSASATAGSANVAMVSSASRKPNATLFVRLGGEAGIGAFTDDFLGRATNDPMIVPFFRGLTPADLQRIRQHVYELLCSATGGPCKYSGKDMKTTHKDMEINNDIWNAFTGHLNETVTRFNIQDRERNELVVIVASLKPDIVNR